MALLVAQLSAPYAKDEIRDDDFPIRAVIPVHPIAQGRAVSDASAPGFQRRSKKSVAAPRSRRARRIIELPLQRCIVVAQRLSDEDSHLDELPEPQSVRSSKTDELFSSHPTAAGALQPSSSARSLYECALEGSSLAALPRLDQPMDRKICAYRRLRFGSFTS